MPKNRAELSLIWYSCDHYVYLENRLGNIREQVLASLVNSEQRRHFGLDKRDSLPRYCRECEVRFARNGECPSTGSRERPTASGALTICVPDISCSLNTSTLTFSSWRPNSGKAVRLRISCRCCDSVDREPNRTRARGGMIPVPAAVERNTKSVAGPIRRPLGGTLLQVGAQKVGNAHQQKQDVGCQD